MIDKRAEKVGVVQDILIEVNIGGEESKSGAAPRRRSVWPLWLAVFPCPAAGIDGNSSLFPPGRAQPQVFLPPCISFLLTCKGKKYDNESTMDILSMGMSKDYPDAILEGRPSSGWALHCSPCGQMRAQG